MAIDQWLPGSIGLMLSLSCAAWFGRLGFRAVNSRSWPTAQGRIIHSAVVPGPRQSASARIRYEYQVGTQKLTSQIVFFGDFIEGNSRVVGDLVGAYPVGREVTVRHHPAQPEVGCLEPRADLRVWLFLGGALVMGSVILNAIVRGE